MFSEHADLLHFRSSSFMKCTARENTQEFPASLLKIGPLALCHVPADFKKNAFYSETCISFECVNSQEAARQKTIFAKHFE